VSDYDVVVIGGGVAGALVADRLSRANKKVAVLEAGSRVDRGVAAKAYATSTTRTLGSPYVDAHYSFAPFPDTPSNYHGQTKFQSTYLRRLGGTTWHWQGHTPRLTPSDFRMFSLYGVARDWPIGYDDLEPWYCQAEIELGVSGDHDVWQNVLGARRSRPFPMTAIWPSEADVRMAEAIDGLVVAGQALRVRPTPQARNSQPYQDRPPCAGNASCIPLCPIGAKYDASVHIERARRRGVAIYDLMKVVKLEHESSRITEIVAIDGRTDERVSFRADVVVVCAHAIESVRLLVASGLTSDQLGRNLMDHPTGSMVALAPWPVWPFRGPPSTSGVDDLRDGPFRSRSAAWKLSLGNDGWGRFQTPDQLVASWITHVGFGAPLREQIEDRGKRLYRISWAAEQLPSADNRVAPTGRTDADGLPEVALQYEVDDYTLGAFPTIRYAISRILDRARMTDVAANANPRAFGGSGHILGTTRMAASADDGVVDGWGRVFVTDNLFLVGGGAFPTIGTANPTLTVAALALRTARHLGGADDVGGDNG
jgi:choline dehydrogenase-like flavoprotein